MHLMEILRYLLLLYIGLEIFIAGGFFFSKQKKGSIFIALFFVFVALDQLNFLYETSDQIRSSSWFFLVLYPVCFLLGPLLWWHFKSVNHPNYIWKKSEALHLFPFILFTLGMLSFYSMEGTQRLLYAQENFMNVMMPLNYLRTTHVSIYGILLLSLIWKQRVYYNTINGVYLTIIVLIYLLTAVLQSYLTAFANRYEEFIAYYVGTATISLIAGLLLYNRPEFLHTLQQKYFTSTLNDDVKKRILKKLAVLKSDKAIFLDNTLNLQKLAHIISEKPHYLSQVFSEDLQTSFSKYINSQRISYAQGLLKDPIRKNDKLLAIALDSGFNNAVTFNKAFVAHVGTTPGKYRQEYV